MNLIPMAGPHLTSAERAAVVQVMETSRLSIDPTLVAQACHDLYRLDELSAVLGLAQVQRLDDVQVTARRNISAAI